MKKEIRVIVVGAGGTGGNFLKEFARYVYSLSNEERKAVSVMVVDGDEVEKKNIARQPFTIDDVGENKAVAMCTAIGDVFGLEFSAYPHYVTECEELEAFTKNSNRESMTIIVGCVDNHQARFVMNSVFEKTRNCIYLDSANEFSVGEVVTAIRVDGVTVSPTRDYYYKGIYDTDEAKKKVTEMSCTELNEVAPQHLVTNMMAANILLSKICSVFTQTVQGGITYFDAFSNFQRFDMHVLEESKEALLKKAGKKGVA